MAEMSELGELAVDYLFGDRSVFADDEELRGVLQQVNEKAMALIDQPGPEDRP